MNWRAKVARASGLREADNRLSVISAMLTWARENGKVLVNHIYRFKRCTAPGPLDSRLHYAAHGRFWSSHL